MSKVKITDSVHALDEIVKELFERIKHIHGEVGTALQGVKRRESQLIEKEKQEREAQQERERRELFLKNLESDASLAVHVGGNDEDDEAVLADAGQARKAEQASLAAAGTARTGRYAQGAKG